MRTLLTSILVLLALSIAGCTHIKTHDRPNQVEVITLISPSGGFEKLYKSEVSLSDRSVRRAIDKLPVAVTEKKYLCNDARETEWRAMKQVEVQLELEAIVESLSRTSKPRQLNEHHRRVLANIPMCDPYVADLTVVSKLVDGYDIVRPKDESNAEVSAELAP